MFNYFSSEEIDTPRVMLIQLSGTGEEYGHITVQIVREAKASATDPDTQRHQYNDGPDARGFRRTSWSSKAKSAYMIEDLMIHSQMTRDRQTPEGQKPYGVDLRYRDVFSIDKGLAIKMADTLKRLDNQMTKLDHKFGYGSGDLATYITRIASIMGVKKFITLKKDAVNNFDETSRYDTWKATEVAWVVNNMVEKFYGRA